MTGWIPLTMFGQIFTAQDMTARNLSFGFVDLLFTRHTTYFAGCGISDDTPLPTHTIKGILKAYLHKKDN